MNKDKNKEVTRQPHPRNTLKIEKGIPIPPVRPQFDLDGFLRKLEIGDSFLVSDKKAHAVYCAAYNRKIKLTRRTVKPHYIRYWRV